MGRRGHGAFGYRRTKKLAPNPPDQTLGGRRPGCRRALACGCGTPPETRVIMWSPSLGTRVTVSAAGNPGYYVPPPPPPRCLCPKEGRLNRAPLLAGQAAGGPGPPGQRPGAAKRPPALTRNSGRQGADSEKRPLGRAGRGAARRGGRAGAARGQGWRECREGQGPGAVEEDPCPSPFVQIVAGHGVPPGMGSDSDGLGRGAGQGAGSWRGGRVRGIASASGLEPGLGGAAGPEWAGPRLASESAGGARWSSSPRRHRRARCGRRRPVHGGHRAAHVQRRKARRASRRRVTNNTYKARTEPPPRSQARRV